jgi:hypothetical protein
LRALIARDLEDAIQELSDDCVRWLSARKHTGHHRLTFEAARFVLGAPAARPLDFFEASRRKRNVIDYDHASVATHTEAKRLWRKRMISSSWSSTGLLQIILN